MEHDTSTNHPSHDTVIAPETDALAEIASEQVDQDITNGAQKKGRLVTVTVDTTPHTVRKGLYIVSDFKRLVGVDPSYQLDLRPNTAVAPPTPWRDSLCPSPTTT